MKKFYLLASVLLATTISTAQMQTVVDFEELQLEEDSFWTGVDGSGFFISNNVIFNNQYNGFWEKGFAYSNKTDNITGDHTNMYSAYPASGADNSKIYAVNYGGDTLRLTVEQTGVNLVSMELTNTTYSYLSMLNGDGFAKKFGSPTNANGDPDGTNGKDFFYITIKGLDAAKNEIATHDFYLADFQSENEEEHYIISDWTILDFTTLGFESSSYLTFEYHSSDMGIFGINTPVYFAMDNLIYTTEMSSLAKQELQSFVMYPNPSRGNITLKGTGEFEVYNSIGEKILIVNSTDKTTVFQLPAGMYVVKNKNTHQTQKLMVQ